MCGIVDWQGQLQCALLLGAPCSAAMLPFKKNQKPPVSTSALLCVFLDFTPPHPRLLFHIFSSLNSLKGRGFTLPKNVPLARQFHPQPSLSAICSIAWSTPQARIGGCNISGGCYKWQGSWLWGGISPNSASLTCAAAAAREVPASNACLGH